MNFKDKRNIFSIFIFTSLRTDHNDGYSEMAQRMEMLAREQPGFLGFESAREGLGISVSYWQDQVSIKQWKANLEHQHAQALGKQQWYSGFKVRICKVERDYEF